MAERNDFNRLMEGQRRAREAREAEARERLGADATQDQIDAYVKQALKQQRSATRLQNEAKKAQADAQKSMAAAQSLQAGEAPTGSTPPPPIPSQQPLPPRQSSSTPLPPPPSASSLYDHPIFGGAVRPNEAASVELHRSPSSDRDHQGRGITNGYLDTWPFDEFNKDNIKNKHGGGKYKAVVLDHRGRVLFTNSDISISGRAIPPMDAEIERGGPYGQGTVFQTEPETGAAPSWFRDYTAYQDERMRMLENELVASRAAPKPEVDRDQKLRDDWERKEAAEEARHERRMAELKLEIERTKVTEDAKAKVAADQVAASQKAQSDLLQTILTTQSTTNATLMQALLSPKQSPQSDMMTPLVTAMGSIMKIQSTQMESMMSVVRDSFGGEEKRTIGVRVLDMIEKGASGIWDKAGDQVLLKVVEGIGKKPDAVPAPFPTGSAFKLPDGRVVPPEICTEFLNRYRARHGADPSLESLTQGLVAIMNHLAGSQQGPPPAQQIPAQQAPPPAPQPAQQIHPAVLAAAQEEVRRAGQAAAEEAIRAGRTPADAAAFARAAEVTRAQEIQRQFAGGGAPLPPTPPQQPAAAASAPSQPVSPTVAVQTPPIAAQTPSVAPTPVATATMVEQAAAAEVISIPWMSKLFLQDLQDAFQARHDPLDFLERAVRSQKLSKEAKDAIGKIYDESGEDESLTSILTKIYALLQPRGVTMPPNFIGTLSGSESGPAWLEAFLFGCSFDTVEEARKEMSQPQEN